MISIGVIDTLGMTSAIEALDVCTKTADVRLVSCERIKGGIVSLTITGEVAAVAYAVDAGVAAAQRLDGYLNHTIIARLDEQTGMLFESPPPVPAPKPGPEPEPASELEPEPEAEPEPEKASDPEHLPATQAAPAAVVKKKPAPKPAQKKPAPKQPQKKNDEKA